MIEVLACLFLGAAIAIGVLWVFAVMLAEFQKDD
jgi:hypothetical protein